MSQPTDSKTGDRPLQEEANQIKQALNQPKDSEKTPQKVQLSTNIAFTSLAQSVIPGNFLRKRLGRQLTVEYIPDFYYILELCQRAFTSAKIDKSLKKVESVNIHSFTLYMAHSLMYVYLKIVHENNPPNIDLSVILNVYLRAGFDSNKVPALCTHWIDGLGKHLDPQTKRTFVPTLPYVDTGALFQSGFFSGESGHLLPNFYCLMAITRLSADRQTGLQLLTSAATQNRSGLLGLVSANQTLVNSTICRKNGLRVPGVKAITKMCDDTELIQVVNDALTVTSTDPVQNLLRVTPSLLAHLKHSQEELLNEIETISLNNISPVGTTLCMIPLISQEEQSIITPAVDVAEVTGPPHIGRMTYLAEYDHNAKISTRNEIINGHVDYAYQTPIVRVCSSNEAIESDGFVFHDPQPNWYLNEHEFDSQSATLHETRAYFKRKI